jgi:hypothetical protein
VTTAPVRHKVVARALGLPRFHARFVIPVVLPAAQSFAAADVRRPLLAEVPIAETDNPLLVPAALALLLLAAANGSFLFLVQRARRGRMPRTT